jgi:antitoxin component YwqK of YwqJK toxin-antitoxin module
MSVTGLPSSSVSAGSGLVSGRELTAREQVSFAREHRRALFASVLFVAAVAVGVGGFAKMASTPRTALRTWHYASGQVHIAAHYTGALKNGPYEEYNQDGSPKATGAFVNDHEDGPWRYHYSGGALESEGTMRGGFRDGPWLFLNADGTRRAVESYQQGMYDGHWVTWLPTGQIATDATWVDGRLEGVRRRWYPSGELAEFDEYKNGVRNGRRLKYSELDGTCLRDETWAAGNLVEARNCFDQVVPVPPLTAG